MTRHFTQEAEETLRSRFLATVDSRLLIPLALSLSRTCDEFHELFPEESILNHAHSTAWIPTWSHHVQKRYRMATRVARIQNVGRWFSWLFAQGELDDNALDCPSIKRVVLGTRPPVVLTRNFQRSIETYVDRHGPVLQKCRAALSGSLDQFNWFVNNTIGNGEAQLPIDETLIMAWLSDRGSGKALDTITAAASRVTLFLDFLVAENQLKANPLRTIWQRYGNQSRKRVICTILGRPQPQPAVPVAPEPRFISDLAEHIQAFIDLKRAMGRRYETAEVILRNFDRFLAERHGTVRITRELAEKWLDPFPDGQPRNVNSKLTTLRQFCMYMVREDPATYVPDGSLAVPLPAHYKPYIFSTAEIRAMLAAARNLPGRPHGRAAAHMLLLLLYCTGLRISEALHLLIADVDLDTCVLHVRDTKFFKSRLVPFSNGLRDEILRYLGVRRELARADGTSYLLINSRRGPYTYRKAWNLFSRVVASAGIPHRETRVRPRLHHLRHSFAAHRVLRWYQDGADIQAKLPLLSTYMGHANVLSTHVYLSATPELLREANGRFERSFCSIISDTSGGDNEQQS